jgi:hypothetical protein
MLMLKTVGLAVTLMEGLLKGGGHPRREKGWWGTEKGKREGEHSHTCITTQPAQAPGTWLSSFVDCTDRHHEQSRGRIAGHRAIAPPSRSLSVSVSNMFQNCMKTLDICDRALPTVLLAVLAHGSSCQPQFFCFYPHFIGGEREA